MDVKVKQRSEKCAVAVPKWECAADCAEDRAFEPQGTKKIAEEEFYRCGHGEVASRG